jgi:hypothetical protein
MLLEPTDSAITKLLELKVIINSDGVYKYSPEFEESAKWLKEHKPGMIESTKLAYKVDSDVAPVLITYAQQFKSQKDIKLVATAYIMLVKHLKRLGIKYNPETNVIYGVYYFNDHILKVEDVKDALP